ncbi:MAG: trimeric intracellular cation channel family protein [Thermoprotei archaeon]
MNWVIDVANYVGIIAFSVSGAMKAIEKRMDLLGVVTLGFATSLAGGITADVLLGMTPPRNLVELQYPLVSLTTSVLTFSFHRALKRLSRLFLYADAVGLGAFAASGASLAYSASPNPVLVVLVGAITAVGGGVVRDLLANEVPMVLTREFYASAAIIGSALYYALRELGVGQGTAVLLAFAATLGLRLMAVKFRWRLPVRG